MKFILLFTFIFNSYLLSSSEVVLGTYSTQENAANVKFQMDQEIVVDDIFRDFLIKKSIQSAVKESGEYYIVTLGPINDIVTQRAVLNRVKKTKFKDAYVLKIKVQTESEIILEDPITVEEIVDEDKNNLDSIITKATKDVSQKQTTHTSNIAKPDIQIQKPNNHLSSNLLDTYLNEILATIAILLLCIIYLFTKNKQQKNDELHDYNTSNENNTKEVDEQVYEVESLDENKIDTTEQNLLTSQVIKQEVPEHGKINKSDFIDFSGSRIMIVEDNLINQKVINGLLSDSEMDIVTVNDGQEALDYLEKDNNFSIILMDIHMPNVDGYEATRIIRANPNYNHITVVALSGDTSKNDINNMKKAGMQEHLEKPLKMDPLYDIFSAYIKVSENLSEKTKELNIINGLYICGEDEEFYKEILNDYINNYSNSIKEIQELLYDKRYSDAQEKLLDINGVTLNIGADRLSESGSQLRLSLNNPEDKEFIQLFKVFTTHFETLEREIKEYI